MVTAQKKEEDTLDSTNQTAPAVAGKANLHAEFHCEVPAVLLITQH